MPLIRDRDVGVERVEFPNGDWYELRKALGHYHRTLLSEMSAITVHLPGRKLNRGEMDILDDETIPATLEGQADLNNRKLAAYIRRWSHTDDKGRAVPITLDMCKLIQPSHARALLEKIRELERQQDGPSEDDPLGLNSGGSSEG